MTDLLNFESSTDELLWVAEALDKGRVKEGSKHPVQCIVEARNGRGYLITVVVDGEDVCDFAWKKSKPGKLLAELFLNPEKAKNNEILLTMQSAVKCACLSSKEVKGVEWFKITEKETDRLYPSYVKTGKLPKLTTETSEPSSVLSK